MTDQKKAPVKKAAKKVAAKKVKNETIDQAETKSAAASEAGSEVEATQAATETSTDAVAAPAKKRAVKKQLTEKQQAALDKKKDRAKEEKAKEKGVLAKIEERNALAAIDVDSKEVTAAKNAYKRIAKSNTTLRADWILIGKVLSAGKTFCIKDDGNVNNVLFGKWIDNSGLGDIPNNKRSDIIWLAEYNDVMQDVLSEEVLVVINEFNSPSHIKSCVRALNETECPDAKRVELGIGERSAPVVKALNTDSSTAVFDPIKFTEKMTAGIVEHFTYGSDDYATMYEALKNALSLVKAAAENAGEDVE